MPELPEVETIRRHLAPHVKGRTLERLTILDARWCEPVVADELRAAVERRRLDRLGRRGKYLVFEFSDDVQLICHLRMSGSFLLDPEPRPPHTRVVLELGDHTLAFVDPRRFGTGELALGPDAADAFFGARLGLEPFDEAFTTAHLHTLTRASRAPIKAFLLDQRKVAGVGNIYADEALFRAKIHPLSPANQLKRAQVEALRETVIAALQAGIDAKGATIDNYRTPDGASGSFQDRFLVHLREGEPCVICGTPVRKLRAAGRGTYVCPRCQPAPRVRIRGQAPDSQAAAASARSSPARSARTSS